MFGHPRRLDGGIVRVLRAEADLTQADLAAAAGIGMRHLVNIEIYGAQPSVRLVSQVVAALERALHRRVGLDAVMVPAEADAPVATA